MEGSSSFDPPNFSPTWAGGRTVSVAIRALCVGQSTRSLIFLEEKGSQLPHTKFPYPHI